MLANIFKPIILWGSGAVLAAGLAGYAIVENYNQSRSESEVVVEKEMPKAQKPVEVASLPKKQVETKPEAAPKPAEQSAAAPASAPKHPLPKFDILRVEKDGYAVIAGSAPAGSKVEILDGDIVIATEKAGSTSEFVVVLDKPLAPGPHDLIIQATLDGGQKLLSAEAGIVNIPDGKNELLAMVTESGKASRILQLPEPKQKASKVEKELAMKMAEKSETAATPALVEGKEAKAGEAQIASLEQQPAAKPEAKVEEKSMATAEQAGKAEDSRQIAKVEEPAALQVPVLIQAAEVEGEKIFIAGTGLSGTSIHIYIDGDFLGKTKVGSEGSYVFEGIGGLNAGRHAVRADMVSENSTDVIARAVVSLLHEPIVIDPMKVAKVEPTQKMTEPAKDAAKMAQATTKPNAAKASSPVEQPKQDAMTVAGVEEKVEMSSSTELAATPKKMEMAKSAVETDSETTASGAEITTGSSVIIRKGDSLWRVSQRRYGEGVRYTTIFDANRNQIRNPDLIYPGQVLEIPAFKEKS